MARKASVKDVRAATDAITRASALLDPSRLRAWDDLGLTVTQLRLLGHLNGEDGIGNAELADHLNVTRPSVSALLERLERHGFIRREISLADRRAIRIHLEPAGRAAVNSVSDTVRAQAVSLLAGLNEDQLKQLTEAFAVVGDANAAKRR